MLVLTFPVLAQAEVDTATTADSRCIAYEGGLATCDLSADFRRIASRDEPGVWTFQHLPSAGIVVMSFEVRNDAGFELVGPDQNDLFVERLSDRFDLRNGGITGLTITAGSDAAIWEVRLDMQVRDLRVTALARQLTLRTRRVHLTAVWPTDRHTDEQKSAVADLWDAIRIDHGALPNVASGQGGLN